MNILVIDDNSFMREYVSELVTDFFRKTSDISVTIKDADSLSVARTILNEGFVPDITFSDYDLGPTEIGPQIFPLIREKNPKAFICLMSSRDRVLPNDANVFIMKTRLQEHIPEVLSQALA